MKTEYLIFLSCFFTSFLSVSSQSLNLPVSSSMTFNSIDLDGDGDSDFEYKVDVVPDGFRQNLFYVGYGIEPATTSQIVRSGPSNVPFQSSETIGSDKPAYQFPNSNSGRLPLISFEQHEVFPAWNYFDNARLLPEPFFTNKTFFIIGFRSNQEDGRHYGWMRFSRPNVAFTTPFTLVAWDWNPVPDQPIQAGLPPAIPLSGVVAKNESDQPVLRLSWPQAVSAWTLESSTNLAPPIQWEYYPTGGAGVDVPLTAEGEPQRYFRLRKP